MFNVAALNERFRVRYIAIEQLRVVLPKTHNSYVTRTVPSMSHSRGGRNFYGTWIGQDQPPSTN